MTKTNKTPTATATCQICERTCKIPGGRISLHGYKRPGCGWIQGSCFGANAMSYEQSCDTLKQYIAIVLAPRHEMRLAEIAHLTAETTTEITVVNRKGESTTYTRGVRTEVEYAGGFGKGTIEMFAQVVSRRVQEAQYEVRQLDREIERCTKRIANWKAA